MRISDKLKERVGKIASARMALPSLVARVVRAKTFRSGAIVTDDGRRIPVVIKDVSEHGAKVEFVLRAELPVSVTIIEPTLKLSRRAQVVWQRDGAAGLSF